MPSASAAVRPRGTRAMDHDVPDFGFDAATAAAFDAAVAPPPAPSLPAASSRPPAAPPKPPPIKQPVPQKVARTVGGAVIVSPKQKGNPILNHIKNVPWEYGSNQLAADYVLGAGTCALFLSLKYHSTSPAATQQHI